MIYLKNGDVVPVDKSELPVTLPKDIDLKFKGNPLDNHPTWKKTKYKKTGEPAVRETDTLDTFVDSSWYFIRFCSPKLDTKPFDEKLFSEDMKLKSPLDVPNPSFVNYFYSAYSGVSLITM